MKDSIEPNPDLIEQTFLKKRSGFLGWARRHAPDLESAEDAVQEAFLRAVSRLDPFLFVEDLSAWVFTVLRNLVNDRWRQEKVRRVYSDIDVDPEVLDQILEANDLDPLDALIQDQIGDALRAAIEALPRDEREVVEGHTAEGKTFREMALEKGVSMNTLMSRKRRAVQKLAAALDYWIDDE